jgi:hypothetical protein
MGKVDYQLILQKQKTGIRAYGLLCLVFLIIIGAYGYFKWLDYNIFEQAVATNEADVVTLKKDSLNEKNEYLSNKTQADELENELNDNLKDVFPANDNYTELTRAFDAFEEQTHTAKSPFVISNIEYQEIQTSEDGNYKYLPVRMTIASSQENFNKFLQYVEQSGSLLGKTRLMDIQSIHLSFGEDESGESGVKVTNSNSELINFSVKIHAYFQNI